MLYITIKEVDAQGRLTGFEKQSTWHVGEPMPRIESRVVTFQADSDELELLLETIKGASKKAFEFYKS
jgi:hypothetical protein